MQETTVTQIVQRPDGGPALRLKTASLTVVEGPDRGKTFTIDQPRVVIGKGEECDVILADEAASRAHADIRATERGYLLRDLGSTNGTIVAGTRLVEALVTAPLSFSIGNSLLQLHPTDRAVEIPLSPRSAFGELIGQSPQMRQVFAILERVAPTDSSVLLEGPSGTGKELAACAVHEHSARAENPYVVVDCGAIPPTLIESELFGHERGAFTGAGEARAGSLESAHGGTVFLDEIGELPLALQPTLLRFLERRQVKRVGARRYATVDVRVVAATNRNLQREVAAGRFREDLFYRLSVVRVTMPPLRDRPDDIRLLAHHFARLHRHDSRELITPDVEALLAGFAWPGNVRQLRHVVEQLAVIPEMAAQMLRDDQDHGLPGLGVLADLPFHEARRRWQDHFDREYLTAHMQRAAGVVSKAAAGAGLPRQSFYRMLERHGLRPKEGK